MPTLTLENIHTFAQLLRYLEEELDWPIPEMEIEEIDDLAFFRYDPEEDLGLDAKTAAKIKSIKQLRQLSSNQPFGIFFIEFDRKKLPVVAMRRILGRLVSKKRDSANPADRKTWAQDDLLFISAFGEDDTRRLDFAHFADDAQNGLPTLRVLGWDADDTDRKLEWVDRQLRQNLLWPDDLNADEWRIQWREAFTLRNREVIDTSKKLARELALLAQKIRARVLASISLETPKGPLRKLHTAFQESLIHDLDHAGFADMYAQTIAYGLLSARMSRPAGLVADDAALMIPNTNPFLRELMEEFLRIGGRHKQTPGGIGIDFDELGVGEVVELLREANIKAVIADFGREKPGEDPVIHFYEYFMTVYDKKQKVSRGVFYTPRPVVSFIVRSVDEILREEFGLPLGLADTTTWGEMAERHASLSRPRRERAGERAPSSTPSSSSDSEPKPFTIPDTVKPEDPFVQILDPATGTGTFLVETIDLIYKRMREHWLSEGHGELELENLWNEYVPEHLLPRLYGFELMMAPYAIAHMKIGLKLADTGYRFQSEQRLRVFLTNSLEPPTDLSEMLEFVASFLAHEARAASAVKEAIRPTVILGNPPYSGSSRNSNEWADRFVRDSLTGLPRHYYEVDGRSLTEMGEQNTRFLLDDYVKFFRLSEWMLSRSGAGTLGFITNHGYIANSTFAGMRRSLCTTLPEIDILDLHGSLIKRERVPSEVGTLDENVFDIRPGVAIFLGRRTDNASRPTKIRIGDVWGRRPKKLKILTAATISDLPRTEAVAQWPRYLFAAHHEFMDAVYTGAPLVTELFPHNSNGVITKRDHFVVDFNREALLVRMSEFADTSIPDEAITEKYGVVSNYEWDMPRARRVMRFDPGCIRPYLYRPFDYRWIYYDNVVIARPTHGIVDHAFNHNPMLIVGRSGDAVSTNWDITFVTDTASDWNIFRRGAGCIMPCLLMKHDLVSGIGGVPNVSVHAARYFGADAECTLPRADAIRLVALSYSILNAPSFRREFAEVLSRDFARIPIPRDAVLSKALWAFGHDLIALHLLEDDYPHASWNQPAATNTNPLATPTTTFHDSGDREVRKVGEKGKTMAPSPDHGEGFGRVSINDTAYFDGVPEPVWKFHIGGYQVCHKWLKDRKGVAGGKNPHPGRILTDEDIAHYHRIVIALNETIRLMGEIDETIEAHGGWPGAFVTDPEEV